MVAQPCEISAPENNLGTPFEVISEHAIQILAYLFLKGDEDKHGHKG